MQQLRAPIITAVGEEGADFASGLQLQMTVARESELEAHAFNQCGFTVPLALKVGAPLPQLYLRASRGSVGGEFVVFMGVARNSIARVEATVTGAEVK